MLFIKGLINGRLTKDDAVLHSARRSRYNPTFYRTFSSDDKQIPSHGSTGAKSRLTRPQDTLTEEMNRYLGLESSPIPPEMTSPAMSAESINDISLPQMVSLTSVTDGQKQTCNSENSRSFVLNEYIVGSPRGDRREKKSRLVRYWPTHCC